SLDGQPRSLQGSSELARNMHISLMKLTNLNRRAIGTHLVSYGRDGSADGSSSNAADPTAPEERDGGVSFWRSHGREGPAQTSQGEARWITPGLRRWFCR